MMIIESYHRLYEMTLPLVGVGNMIMGITLLILCLAKKYGRLHNRSGLMFLTIAMLALSAINLAEYVSGVHKVTINTSLAIVIIAASIELFLFFFTYVSLLDKSFVTRNRIIGELVAIMLFTTPPLFVQDSAGMLFHIFFGIALAFYIVKLTINFIIYRRYLRLAISRIEDYHSDESSSLLAWINRTFYVAIAVGVFSIFAPMGDYSILVCYNLFLFFAFFYIYTEVIRNIYVFDGSMAMIEQQEKLTDELQDADKDSFNSFMNPQRQAIYQKWIDKRGYTDPYVTAGNVAMLLNTNRSRLSLYLNNELGVNYYEWIAHLRIEYAKKLLIEEPETPIHTIAVRIGIEDKSNFGRAFRRVTGMSPTHYRDNHLMNKK